MIYYAKLNIILKCGLPSKNNMKICLSYNNNINKYKIFTYRKKIYV